MKKKRVIIPGAVPGDVFAYQKAGDEMTLRRIHRKTPRKKPTKAQAVKTIRGWKFKPAMSWEKLRALTREA